MGKVLHGRRGLFAHAYAFTTCENEGCESASLDVEDPSAVSQTLLALVLTINARETLILQNGAPGWKTLTSKNASFLPVSESQKPWARMSSLASSSLLAERVRISPFKGCSRGSTAASLETSRKTPASVFRRSLCLSVWKPPSLHIGRDKHQTPFHTDKTEVSGEGAIHIAALRLAKSTPVENEAVSLEGNHREPRGGSTLWIAFTHRRCRSGSARMTLSAATVSRTDSFFTSETSVRRSLKALTGVLSSYFDGVAYSHASKTRWLSRTASWAASAPFIIFVLCLYCICTLPTRFPIYCTHYFEDHRVENRV